jgi:hypothetical protein
MPMLRRARAFLLLTIFGVAPVGAGAQAALFARHATTLTDIYGSSRPMTVTAPDDRTRAIARFTNWRNRPTDDHLTVFLGGDDHHFAGGPKAELLWAPDSRAIAVTADDGATPSGFALSILVRKAKGRHWRQIGLTERVTRLFAPEMRCADEDEVPNVGAVGWTSGQRLIVAAQVPPHVGCADGGHVAAYVVDVPSGEVLMRLDPRTLHRRYRAMLGTALAGGGRHRHRRHRGG